MGKRTRAVLRKTGHRLPPLKIVSLRIEADVFERCQWAATARSTTRSQFIRDTLNIATKDARPTVHRRFRGLGTESEQARWRQVAERYGLTEDDFIRRAANVVVRELSTELEKVANG